MEAFLFQNGFITLIEELIHRYTLFGSQQLSPFSLACYHLLGQTQLEQCSLWSWRGNMLRIRFRSLPDLLVDETSNLDHLTLENL
jgi:hypothetical protein